MSWINPQQGWALVTTPHCSGATCVAVLGTSDGGTRWTLLSAVSACLSGCQPSQEQVNSIQFASAEDGYLFDSLGTSPLMITSDGGRQWAVQTGARATVAMAVEGSKTLRISSSGGGCPGPCNWAIDESTVDSTQWTTVDTPSTAYNDSAQLVVSGSDAYALFPGNIAAGAGTQQADLYISQDDGSQWAHQGDPCGDTGSTPDDAQSVAAAPGGVLVVVCALRTDGSEFVIVSSNAGGSFGSPETVPLTSARQVAATSASKLFVGNGYFGYNTPSSTFTVQLLASSNGGETWDTAVEETGKSNVAVNYLGFVSASTGWWLVPGDTIWTTTDSGASWSHSNF
ncbi:MAG: hypothetical protein WBA31_06815 [Candidatus Dormiibacterota bacterium]